MKAIMRAYQTEEDYWCIRKFLREVSLLNHRHDFAWSLLRWDYWRWHVNENIFRFQLEQVITNTEASIQQLEADLVALGNSTPESPEAALINLERQKLAHSLCSL